jgi:hypothetical protein
LVFLVRIKTYRVWIGSLRADPRGPALGTEQKFVPSVSHLYAGALKGSSVRQRVACDRDPPRRGVAFRVGSCRAKATLFMGQDTSSPGSSHIEYGI